MFIDYRITIRFGDNILCTMRSERSASTTFPKLGEHVYFNEKYGYRTVGDIKWVFSKETIEIEVILI